LYEESAFLNAPSRLAKRVLNLAMLHGRQVDDGYELRISQSDLAQFLGMSRQIVNHHLQSWRSEGYVDVARARLKVLDPSSLRRIAGSAGDRAD
ncbi:MAG: helix-turn-helix domain-containing protein, partial [Gammaproteobacteria bacterium]|nr:helix-turn-helix domain-containing protein [Gammaproteobacteria bacterium]